MPYNSDTEDLIDQVIYDWMVGNRIFTSLHITNDVKRIGAQCKPPRGGGRHSEMADYVRQTAAAFAPVFGYDCEVVRVGEGDYEAMIWYPSTADWADVLHVAAERVTAIQPVDGPATIGVFGRLKSWFRTINLT